MAMEPPPPLSLFSGSTRKQNVACDACRAKKIRCQRVTTAQRCGQCAAKDLECTSNYIEQLQNKPRRPRRFKSNEDREREKEKEARKSDDEGRVSPPTASGSGGGTSRPGSADASASASTSVPVSRDPGPSSSASASIVNINMGVNPDAPRDVPMAVDDPLAVFALMQPQTVSFKRDAAALQADLLRYLFCPVPVLHQEWRYSDVWGMEQARAGACDIWEEAGGGIWDEAPSAAHLGFWAGAVGELESVAIELIDTYFTIVDPRVPILDAHKFLARFQHPTTDPAGPLPHALLAVVLAFGARFVDHNVFRADREECSARDTDGAGRPRSRLVQLMVVRAREVTEMNKSCRTANLSNAQTMLLLEGLLCQSCVLSNRYRANNLGTAARHLDQLPDAPMMQVTSEKDEKTRTQLALYIISGSEAALFRLRPDCWGSNVEIGGAISATYETAIDHAALGLTSTEDLWLLGARAGTGIIRRLCTELWTPKIRATGIPLPLLRDFVHDHSSWRDLYLGKLGMPASFPSPDQDFVATMKAATTDILFHGMWLVVERAVRDFGIQEVDDAARHMFAFEVQQMKDRLSQEAVHSAMRITMLAALAAEQGLLRLDPLILYRPIYDAGMFLARRGQDESLGCVAGLKQYAVAYPQMWDLAIEIEATLSKTHVPLPPGFAMNGGVPGILA